MYMEDNKLLKHRLSNQKLNGDANQRKVLY